MSGRREIEKILEQSPSSIKRSKLLGKETVTGTELQREEVFGLGRGAACRLSREFPGCSFRGSALMWA